MDSNLVDLLRSTIPDLSEGQEGYIMQERADGGPRAMVGRA